MKTQDLPFTIRIVKDDIGFEKAVQMRQDAYGRHLPEFANSLVVEESDKAPGTIVLIAESKQDGQVLGTMRIQTNEYAQLALEQSVTLPVHLQGVRLAEATRFALVGGTIGKVVKAALCKSLLQYCMNEKIYFIVIVAREPLDKMYEDEMSFKDVFGENELRPMAHVGNMLHRVMYKRVSMIESDSVGKPFYDFLFETEHPDIILK